MRARTRLCHRCTRDLRSSRCCRAPSTSRATSCSRPRSRHRRHRPRHAGGTPFLARPIRRSTRKVVRFTSPATILDAALASTATIVDFADGFASSGRRPGPTERLQRDIDDIPTATISVSDTAVNATDPIHRDRGGSTATIADHRRPNGDRCPSTHRATGLSGRHRPRTWIHLHRRDVAQSV